MSCRIIAIIALKNQQEYRDRLKECDAVEGSCQAQVAEEGAESDSFFPPRGFSKYARSRYFYVLSGWLADKKMDHVFTSMLKASLVK